MYKKTNQGIAVLPPTPESSNSRYQSLSRGILARYAVGCDFFKRKKKHKRDISPVSCPHRTGCASVRH